MEIKLRKFNKDDVDFVMNNWVNTDKLDGFFKDKTRKSLKESFEKYKQEKSGERFLFTYCIDLEGRPIGVIQFTEKYQGVPNLNLYIEDVYRGKGYGTKAFELAKKIMKSKNFALITSSCRQNNLASVRLHKKLGFEIIRTEKSPNGIPMHRWKIEL